MHLLLPLKVKIWIVVGLAGVISSIASWFTLHPLTIGGIVASVELIIVLLLSYSWPLATSLPGLLRPRWMFDLTGRWVGKIESQAVPGQPIQAALLLNQNWHEVVFSLETDQMHSRSTDASPQYDRSTRELRFRYFFETNPTIAAAAINPPQKLGCAIARVSLDKPDRMSITYTNERGMGGDIELRKARDPANKKLGSA